VFSKISYFYYRKTRRKWVSSKKVVFIVNLCFEAFNFNYFPRPVEFLWAFHDGKTLVFHTRVWRWFLRKTMFSCRRERSFYRAPPRGVKNRRVFSSCLARDVYSIESVKARILTTACSEFQKDTCFCNSNFLYKRFFEKTCVFTRI
jgi:hypothetical protein